MNEQEETEFYNRIHSRDHFLNPPKDIVFLQIRLEEKSRDEDWRAFLDFMFKTDLRQEGGLVPLTSSRFQRLSRLVEGVVIDD